LGRFDAPRWNMVSPESIERVDVLYGPYSALFPGNSIGTTVALTQRAPKGLEVSGRVSGYQQSFSQYGQNDRFDGHQFLLHAGNKLESGLWFTVDAHHQNSTSQPMQYQTASADAAGNFAAVAAPETAKLVTGIQYDVDPNGRKRAVFGANAGAIDHTVQDTLSLRSGYRFTPELQANATAAWWSNDTQTRNVSFLRDASRSAVWSGKVTDGTNVFDIPASGFTPTLRDETHRQLGATLKTLHARGWNASLVVSDYRIVNDANRVAAAPDPQAANGGAGSVTQRRGTGWNTLEAQASWTPSANDWTGGQHTLAAGLHRNAYRLNNTVSAVTNTADWRSGEGALSQYYRGRTEVWALYAQDAWQFHPDARLTLGWRAEQFRTFDGRQFGNTATVNYDRRTLYGQSPKAALAWNVSDELLVKLSLGRGVRFPNVEELYNGTLTATNQTLSDPTLQAETADAAELSTEYHADQHRLRLSLFHDTVKNAILRQTTTDPAVCKTTAVGAANYTCVQNVDRVNTSGVELAWQTQDWLIKGLGVDTSAAYTFSSKVVANSNDPAMVGQWWLRVPRTRAALQLSYRPNATWLWAAGYRHEGRAYNDTYNLDVNPEVYGSVSRVNQLDVRASVKLHPQIELALGANNVTNKVAYQFHPYPGRTLFAELRFSHSEGAAP
jgi:iron complex outermembrane recepter protein